ncbi:SymE family type I addiction module toxin [Pseudomonas sp. B11]|uniref:SymE family type I addiction module toxin n=1 Tax=Pseudomonas sp. BIOMIG1BAC TaxID=1758730 RepID=UPI0009F3B76C|nr:type I toxin-antitoxin system SymE family toxin [Pseudomonas sp. BIOMIG1BAC]UMZ12302.1 SymE family type I addiction module toxin [Pseudomonas sp. MPFS]
MLRLPGHWLQQAGFEVNQKIRIKVSKNRLVVTAERKIISPAVPGIFLAFKVTN